MKNENRRYAEVRGAPAETVAKYLPHNYRVDGQSYPDPVSAYGVVYISGVDDAGWTLDDYVIPRLGSGWIGCREVTPSYNLCRECGKGVLARHDGHDFKAQAG